MAGEHGGYINIAWHVGAHLSGVVILALAYVSAERVQMIVRWALFIFFLLASADAVLTRYHQWNFAPVPPHAQRFALVTGATAGLGREIAYLLAERRYSLVLTGRTEPILARMRAEMEFVNKPIEVHTVVCDLATPAGVQTLLDFIQEKELVIDVLVNAARSARPVAFQSMSDDAVNEMVHVHVTALTRITRAIVAQMTTRGMGRVLNVSALGAAAPTPTAAVVNAANAFTSSFSQALNYELRATGVTVTCFEPGAREVNLQDPSVGKPALSVAERSPWVTHPKDCATYACDAMFNAESVVHDSYLTQWVAFLLRSFVPHRVGQALMAIAWHAPDKAMEMIKR